MIYVISDLVNEANEANTTAQQGPGKAEMMALLVVDDVCLRVEMDGCSVVLDPRLPYRKPDIASGHPGAESDIGLVWDSERFNTRSTASSVVDRKTLADVTAKSQLFLMGFVGDDIHLHTRLAVGQVPNGVVHTRMTREDLHYARPRLWLAEQVGTFSELVIRNKAKRKLLAQIKLEDSIAALEKQIDLLSAVVFALMKGEPAPAWADELKQAIEANSSTDHGGATGSIAGVAAHKAGIRALQAQYFASRAEVV